MNKKKYQLFSIFALFVFVSVIAVASWAGAFSGEITNVENFYEATDANGNIGAVTSPFQEALVVSLNGEKTRILKGTCEDATLDIVSIANPFGTGEASTTVATKVRIRIDGVATSSGIITCGAATAADATPSYDLMTTGSLATSTGLGCIMENGLLTADNGNSYCPDGGSVSKITLTEKYPYFNCEITSESFTNAFTNPNNTFECEYMIELHQMR